MLKENLDIAFVILHYLTIDETIKSIEYINKNIDTCAYHIVVVDNNSGNETGKELQAKYACDDRVSVLLNLCNEGYARGLNKGIRFIKDKYEVTYMVLMNNDVYLLDDTLFSKLDKAYSMNKFAVLGPMILSGDGRCDTNPYREKMPEKADLERQIRSYQRIIKVDKRKQYWWYVFKQNIKKIYNLIKGNYPPIRKKQFWERQENVVIHGSIFILSPTYFEYFDELDPNTYMYAEEYVLYLHIREKALKMIYDPSIQVLHVGSSSIGQVAKKGTFGKICYHAKHSIDSLKYVVSLMENE